MRKNKKVSFLNEVLKPIRKKIRSLKNSFNVRLAVLRNSHYLLTLHPYVGFGVVNNSNIKEVKAGIITFGIWSVDSLPRVHNFQLDTTLISVCKNLRKIPTAITFTFTVKPVWLIWDVYNYKTLKNLQSSSFKYGMLNLVMSSADQESPETTKRKLKANSRVRKLTKLEKQVLSGEAKVITDGNGKVIKIITKGKKK